MKKILLFVLTLALLLSCVPVVALAATPEGDAITTAAEFEAMSPTGTYYLANDIDFGGKAYPNYILADFSGTLDGQGYKLYNFSIDNSGATAIDSGVFSTVAASANTVIKNLVIGASDSLISVVPFHNTNGNALAVVAGSSASDYTITFENVQVYADMTTPLNGRSTYVGGIIGNAKNLTMNNCEMNGKILSQSGGKSRWVNAGGLVGVSNGTTSLNNCINNATIQVQQPSNTTRGAGIMAYANGVVTMNNCVNFGAISLIQGSTTRDITYGYMSGVFGDTDSEDVTLSNCANFGNININEQGTKKMQFAGIVGRDRANNEYTNCINYGTMTTNNDFVSNGIYGVMGEGSVFTGCFNAKATPDANPATTTVGVQNKPVTGNTFDVRFIATVDSLEHQNVGVAGVAYWTDNGQTKTWNFRYNCQTVYKSILATEDNQTVEYSAAALEANYLMALTFQGVPANTDVTFAFTSFAEDSNGTVTYGASSSITYNNGVAPASMN